MEDETVIAGVDTHKDVHVLCLLDGLGRKIWSGSFMQKRRASGSMRK